MFARDVDGAAGKDGNGIVLSRTHLIAMFFLSTKEKTDSMRGVSFLKEYSQRMKALERRVGVGGSAPHPACFFVFPVLREVCFLLIEESVLNGVK